MAPGRLTSYVFWTCLIASTGGFIFGYDLSISRNVASMTPFLTKFFPDSIPRNDVTSMTPFSTNFFPGSENLTLFLSAFYIAALYSSLIASWVTRKFGRRVTMIWGGDLAICGALLNGFTQNLRMLYVGRILLGYGVGFVNQSVPLYLSEMAPQNLRGCLNMLFQLAITVGIFFAGIINYLVAKRSDDFGWRLSLGLAVIPGLIVFLGGCFLSDSPISLIERGELAKAKNVLKKIRGTKDIDEEYRDLIAASEASNKVTNPWSRLFYHRKYRPQLAFALLIPTFQQFTGFYVFMFCAPVLFRTLGFGDSASSMSSLMFGGVNMVATGLALHLADKKGRRPLFLVGGVQMFLSQCVIGGLLAYKFGYTEAATLNARFAMLVVYGICFYVAGYAYSWGPLGWLVPSEIFPLEVRSAAQSVNVSMNMFWMFVMGEIFSYLLCHMKFWLFFAFAGYVLVMTLDMFFLFPETKGIPIEGMYEVWKKHPFWGKMIRGGSPQLDVEIDAVKRRTKKHLTQRLLV